MENSTNFPRLLFLFSVTQLRAIWHILRIFSLLTNFSSTLPLALMSPEGFAGIADMLPRRFAPHVPNRGFGVMHAAVARGDGAGLLHNVSPDGEVEEIQVGG